MALWRDTRTSLRVPAGNAGGSIAGRTSTPVVSGADGR
jgi:hypothetical protein